MVKQRSDDFQTAGPPAYRSLAHPNQLFIREPSTLLQRGHEVGPFIHGVYFCVLMDRRLKNNSPFDLQHSMLASLKTDPTADQHPTRRTHGCQHSISCQDNIEGKTSIYFQI